MAKGHVRVIEDQTAEEEEIEPEVQVLDGQEEDAPMTENRPSGFHVRPIPIDEPFSEA